MKTSITSIFAPIVAVVDLYYIGGIIMKLVKAILGVIVFIIVCLLAPIIFGALVSVGAVLAASLPLVGLLGIVLIPGIIVGLCIAKLK